MGKEKNFKKKCQQIAGIVLHIMKFSVNKVRNKLGNDFR